MQMLFDFFFPNNNFFTVFQKYVMLTQYIFLTQIPLGSYILPISSMNAVASNLKENNSTLYIKSPNRKLKHMSRKQYTQHTKQ